MKMLISCVILMGMTVVATADEEKSAPLVARIKFVELDKDGKQVSKIDFSATFPSTGPVVASVTDSSNHRIQILVEKYGKQQFKFYSRIAKIDLAGKEKVIAEPTLIVVQNRSGNFVTSQSGQTHCGVIVTNSEAKETDPLSEVGRFQVIDPKAVPRTLPQPAKE